MPLPSTSELLME